jgi:hypothetical protein
LINKKVKSTLVSSLTIAIVACTNIFPNDNVGNGLKHFQSNENFSDLENEYQFSTKALTKEYLKRKLEKWLCRSVQVGESEISCHYGHELEKEIAYARYKHPALFCAIVTEDPTFLEDINGVPEISRRRSIDIPFATFLDSGCNTPVSTGEIQVNTFTTNNQLHSSVAMDDSGNFVVTWQSPQDGNSYGIYAQRYNSVGVPQGSEFQVNTYTSNNQVSPSVAIDSDGDFVIAWTSREPDGDLYGIYAQRYNSEGIRQGTEFHVNTYTTLTQNFSTVAMDDAGDFVIAWQSGHLKYQNGQDGDSYGIFAQRYNATGVPQGSEFQVNTTTTYKQVIPSIAMDSDGDFVITWVNYYQYDHKSKIMAQRYNSAGVPQDTEFNVNPASGFLDSPAIAMDSDGDFVITWHGPGDNSYFDIFAQRFNSTGIPQGSDFRVNTFTTDAQGTPAIAMDSDGDFVISWSDRGHDNNHYNNYEIFAQRYNSEAVPQGTEFHVNTFTTNLQFESSIAIDSKGDFVITWTSPGQDGGGYGVYGQRYNAEGESQQ